MAFGNILREARERKNLTPAQVAETTRMLQQIVEDLEVENFKRIAAPIYGRSFIKLYAGLVGLDPAPLLDDFNLLYNAAANEPEPPKKLAPVSVPKPVAAPKPIAVPAPIEPEPVTAAPSSPESPPSLSSPQTTSTDPEPPSIEDDFFNYAPPPEPPKKAAPVVRGKSTALPQEKPKRALRRVSTGAPSPRASGFQIFCQKQWATLTQFLGRLSSVQRPQWGRPPVWILLAGVCLLIVFAFVLYTTLGLGSSSRGSRPSDSPVSRYVFEPPEFYVD